LRIYGFAPIADASCRVLVLGSMPGKASLGAEEYYAHPGNLFWRLMEVLFGLDASASYAARTRGLVEHGVALWDTVDSCVRESSLDSDIEESSIVVNDFGDFYRAHPRIRTVCFNGAKSEQTYRKRVLPELGDPDACAYHRLPSTSPANASIPYPRKLESWRVVAAAAKGNPCPSSSL
jgi:TDG/mug DNA glycosylase family protein